MAGFSALALLGGVLGVAVVETPAQAATTKITVSLIATTATFATRGAAPGPWPTTAAPVFTGKETVKTVTAGAISAADLAVPVNPESNTGSTETLVIRAYKASGTYKTGTYKIPVKTADINSTGELAITATVMFEVHIVQPVTEHCVTKTPVPLSLTSSTPYTKTTHSVTVSNSTIDVPYFSSHTCTLAASHLDTTFSSAPGKDSELSLTLYGTLTVPPKPSPSTTVLTATPSGPQEQGTSVTLKATVEKTAVVTATAHGPVTFLDGTTVLATEGLTNGSAIYTTSTLPGGTDKLTAAYAGGSHLLASTSVALTYVVEPAPTVAISKLPNEITGGKATEHLFTVKITNPASGGTLTKLYFEMTLSGMTGATATTVFVHYKDTAGTWCPLLDYQSNASSVIWGYVAETTTCAPGTYPASFSLAHGSSLTIPMEIQYPTVTGYKAYGVQKIVAELFTGTCTSSTKCVAMAPLRNTAAPSAKVTLAVVPATPLGSKLADGAQRKATSPVAKTFDVSLKSALKPTGATITGASAPTGRVTYALTGVVVADSVVTTFSGQNGATKLVLYNTTGLTVGKTYQVVSTYVPEIYTGHAIYVPSTLTETFIVTTAPSSGTPFVCQIGTALTGAQTMTAYVSATGAVVSSKLPATGTKTKAAVMASDADVSLTVDPAYDAETYNTAQTVAEIRFSAKGSTIPTPGPITFVGTTGTKTAVTGTWTDVATTVTVPLGTTPGTPITLGVSTITFVAGFATWKCAPKTAKVPAPVGATVVAGTTLSASPAASATYGTPVTLTAHVYPEPATGATPTTVTFKDGAMMLGTETVATTGAGRGTASFTVDEPSVGSHSFIATWAGSGPVKADASAAVPYSVYGSTLSASPAGSADLGTPVTLTATVSPTPATGAVPGEVQFFNGSTLLGTTLVSTTGSSRGTATLTLSTLAAGSYSFTAAWTGTAGGGVPFNASAALPYTIGYAALVVTTQPQSLGVKSGETATFTAAATGTSPTVQWQVSSDGGTTWSNVPGAISDTYSLTAVPADDNNQYRAVFTNGGGTAATKAATLFVTARGYWLTASNGGVYAYGDLPFLGSAGGLHLNAPIVGSVATPTGGGYWLVASDGGIFAFGSAQFYGSMGGKPLNQPIVGMAATPTGKGYYEVASDGGIFAFGSAQFYGSMGSLHLNKPITAMATAPTDKGYWLVASDGGVFAFGSAGFYGTVAGVATSPVVGMMATTDGRGYLEIEADGRVIQFGDAALAGTALTQTLSGASIVAVSA